MAEAGQSVAMKLEENSVMDDLRDRLSGASELVMSRPLKGNEPKNLRPVHKKIIALSAAGMRNNEIAELLALSESWVSVVLNHPEAQDIRNEMTSDFVLGLHGDTRDIINASTNEAQLKMLELMRNASKENVQYLAAKDILDRGGFKPKEQVEVTRLTLNSNDALLITKALQETNVDITHLAEAEVTSELMAGLRK